jgi:hypothetical protein
LRPKKNFKLPLLDSQIFTMLRLCLVLCLSVAGAIAEDADCMPDDSLFASVEVSPKDMGPDTEKRFTLVDAKRFFPGNAIISGVELFQSGGDGVSVGSRLFVGIFRPVMRDSCRFMLMDKRKISIEVGYHGLLYREFVVPMSAERGDHFGFFSDFYGVLQYNNVAVEGTDGGGDNAYCSGSTFAGELGNVLDLSDGLFRDYPIKPVHCSFPAPGPPEDDDCGLKAPYQVCPYNSYNITVSAPKSVECDPLVIKVVGTDGYIQINEFHTPNDGTEFKVEVPGAVWGTNDTITMVCHEVDHHHGWTRPIETKYLRFHKC